ncbi:polysaccharide biosynthesis tyrosine autokinase [Leptolyngbya cf. ectocarpi LEGE 11479]|uniref:non-specific protein-tyrosine kinase n=1 Tax=Leptolyngbya cf. ectocarpi LEGE 11479 TaxID=1828722 RepID=A0A928ZWU0_LEPEC|nr:polysaccharide biosynthesis tyrosine autokinase [Leptolyngbya ectocarpi]MBE9068850.1 polysaccharide biosynthesis tyrosine autokinase [Leptolyngbya cf. ectocarpi LEGE 11479]
MNNLDVSNSGADEKTFNGFSGSQVPWDEDELDLKQVLTVLRRRAWVIAGIATGVMGVVLYNTLRQEPVYEGTFQVLVEPVNVDNQVQDFSDFLGDTLPRASSGLDYETQVQVLRSPELIEQVMADLRGVDPEIDYKILLANLVIRRVGETKIIEVSYRDADPAKIRETLDVLAGVYLDYSLKERQTNLRQGIQFVNKQLPELEGRVDQLQSQLEDFRQANNFIDPATQNKQIASRSEALSTQRLNIDRQLAQARAAHGVLGTAGGEAALQDAPVYQQLIQELRQVETEIAAGLTRFQPDTLEIQVLQDKRERLLPVLAAEAQRVLNARSAGALNEIQVLETQSQTLALAESKLQATLTELPTLAREYSDLQRELEISVKALSRFLETRETLQIEAAQTEIPWELIEAPLEPTLPISPNVRRSLLLGAVASILLGVGTALMLEKLDTICRTLDELKATVKLPLLGMVPYQSEFDGQGAIATNSSLGHWLKQAFQGGWLQKTGAIPDSYGYGRSQFLESMRLLQTNLLLLGSERPIQSIIFSSSMPGEGKSTIARHLAQVAATMGKRVLLVDADLRQPMIHQRLELDNTKGLSNLLSGNASRDEVLQQAIPFLEFYVITAGSMPPDPVKLLSSQRMQQLMTDLEKEFDLIVYDAPPLLGLADTTLMTSHTDGLILVARVNQCDRDVLAHVMETIRFSKMPVLGLVANGVMPNTKGYKYYGYGTPARVPKPVAAKGAINSAGNGTNNGSSNNNDTGFETIPEGSERCVRLTDRSHHS